MHLIPPPAAPGPALAEAETPHPKATGRMLLAWLAFAAPCWWAAKTLVDGLPALLLAAISPYSLASVFLRPDGLVARVFPPGAVTEDYQPGMAAALRDPFAFSVLLALLLAALAFRLRSRLGWFWFPSLLFTASAAVALFQPLAATFGGRSPDPAWLPWLSVAAGVAIAYPSFQALASLAPVRTRLGKLTATGAMLSAPPVAFGLLLGRGGSSPTLLVTLLPVFPLLALAVIRQPQTPSPLHSMPLRISLGGLAVSLALLLVGSVPRQPAWNTPNPPLTASRPPLPSAPYPKLFFQRGVSFTSEWPDSYESPKAHALLRKLRSRGVDAIALVPYASASPSSAELRHGHWERDEAVLALAATAHQLGMRVMLKPQVWFRGSYPGDFDLASDSQRAAWFAEYEKFALHHAQLAQQAHADLFCVGTEFAKLTRHETFWRQLIAKIRNVYPGPLTYAANFGREFETLAFWDALDYIGLNNYYPLPDSFRADELLRTVETVQQRFDKPVLFTEGGYSSYAGGHRTPWAENEGPLDLDVQARAYDAVLAAFWDKPWFYGAYWWKVGSNSFGGPLDRSHTPWGKPAMDIISHWYARQTPGRPEYPPTP